VKLSREPRIELSSLDATWLAAAAREFLDNARRNATPILAHAVETAPSPDELAALGRAMFAAPPTSREHRPGGSLADDAFGCGDMFAAGTVAAARSDF
jgi:hypothetical protein